jgi:hypothetical protein
MTTLYIVLKVSALLTFIVLPLVGPKKKKKKKEMATAEISDWAIDQNGDLQPYVRHSQPDHHPVK